MMKSKFQKVDLNLLLPLVSIMFLIYSCNNIVKKANDINKKKDVVIISETIECQEEFKYNKEDVIKALSLNIDSEDFTVLFLLDKEGSFGDSGFEKYIDIVILKKNIIIDKIEFSNPSILCDIELVQKSVEIMKSKLDSNENLFFAILESCDGEDPDTIQIIIWDGEEHNYDLEIPKYFETKLDKDELLRNLSGKFDESINESVIKTVSQLIDKR